MKLTKEYMKILLCLINLLFLCSIHAELENVYNPDNWIELSKIHITSHSPTQEYRVLWMNTYSQKLYPCTENYPFPGDWSEEDHWMERYGWMGHSYPDNEWITASVADRVPDNAKAIFLVGRLIVSNGYIRQTGSMTLSFRRKGEKKEYQPPHQACISNVPECNRSGIAIWIPLDDNKEFEFKWTRSSFGLWPDNPAYGMSLSLNAWAE